MDEDKTTNMPAPENADGYYGEELGEGDIDMSFLDEKPSEK